MPDDKFVFYLNSLSLDFVNIISFLVVGVE
jgi:hypothetical protein